MRHFGVLRLLSTYPLLSSSELALIAQMREETVNRYLNDLRHAGCITQVTTKHGTRFLLDDRSLRFLAVLQQMTFQRLTEEEATGRVQRGVVMLKRNLHHTAGIYTFLGTLCHAAMLHHHQVLWFETGPHSERSYRYRSIWRNFRPDAAFAYQAEQQRLVAWLEWDEGSMTMRNLAAKLYEYQRYVRGREWVSYDTRVLPILLFVVPEKGQEMRVIQVTRSILGKEGIIVRSTTSTRLAKDGPLAAIWFPVVPPLPNVSARQTLLAEKER